MNYDDSSDPRRRRRREGQERHSTSPQGRHNNNNNNNSLSWTTQVVTTAVVAYGAYRLVDWAWTTWGSGASNNNNNNTSIPQQSWSNLFMSRNSDPATNKKNNHNSSHRRHRRQRQARLWRCRRECREAWQALGVTVLRPFVAQATDTRHATQRLKELRTGHPNIQTSTATTSNKEEQQEQQQHDLWEQVKVGAVTRFMATTYAHALLLLVLQVQVHLWGAKLWHEQQQQQADGDYPSGVGDGYSQSSSAASARMQSYRHAHETVLQRTFAYYFQTGLPALVQCVKRAVERVMAEWHVWEPQFLKVTAQQFITEVVQPIRAVVEEQQAIRRRFRRSLCRFFVPNSEHPPAAATPLHASNDEMAPHLDEILDETWDWLESPLLQDALEEILDLLFDYQCQHDLPFPRVSDNDDDGNSRTHAPLSLAQLLPKLSKCPGPSCDDDNKDVLWDQIQALPPVQDIGNLAFAVEQ